MLKLFRVGGILMALVAMLMLAACAPGSKTANQGSNQNSGGGGSSGGGTASSGSVEQSFLPTSGPYCTPPKNITSKNFSDITVGFSQSEKETNPFRSTETQSVRTAAKDAGVKLLYANGQSQEPKQISDIRDLLSRGSDALVVAPLQSNGLQSVLDSANKQNVPVVLIDRETAGKPCKDYITNIESNFVRQGKQAAQQLDKLTNGKAQIAVLEGAPGASVTNDRTKGFNDYIKQHSGLKVVASQTGNFVRTDGQQVMEQIIQANPNIDAVYAQNDEMALGAISALKAAGKNPGTDIKIVSIDGTKDAAQAIVNGNLNATVTTNPRFGPIAMKTLKDYFSGKKVPQAIRVKDQLITEKEAKQYLNSGAY